MRYSHIFVTHASLQEYLVEAILRREGIAASTALLLRVRNSHTERTDFPPGLTVINGDRYRQFPDNNPLNGRRENRRRVVSWQREVADLLQPNYHCYAPMYTYWFLRELLEGAGAYFILEDGLGSYRSEQEWLADGERSSVPSLRTQLRRRWQSLSIIDQPRAARSDNVADFLAGATRCYVTHPRAFPMIGADRRVVLTENLFPPLRPGAYDGATVLCTSCPVERGKLSLAAYLDVLRGVVVKIGARGWRQVYFKLHPVQEANPVHARAYRALLTERQDVTFTELPPGLSIERLAAGNRLSLIVGYSTLALHVSQLGRPVYSFLTGPVGLSPVMWKSISVWVQRLLTEITEPL